MQMLGHAHEDVLNMRKQVTNQDRVESQQRERYEGRMGSGIPWCQYFCRGTDEWRHLEALAVIPRKELPCLVCDQYQVHSMG